MLMAACPTSRSFFVRAAPTDVNEFVVRVRRSLRDQAVALGLDGSGGCGMDRLLPSTFSSRAGIGRRAGGRGTAFELGEALLELLRRQRPHVDVDRLRDVGGLRR